MLGDLENFTLGMGLNVRPYQKLPKKYVSSLNGYGEHNNISLKVILVLIVAALIIKKVI